jgi:hypothetical protein
MNNYEIDHKAYQQRVRVLSEEALRWIIQDASEAMEDMPDGPKKGYYADEVSYCAAELLRRSKQKGVKS